MSHHEISGTPPQESARAPPSGRKAAGIKSFSQLFIFVQVLAAKFEDLKKTTNVLEFKLYEMNLLLVKLDATLAMHMKNFDSFRESSEKTANRLFDCITNLSDRLTNQITESLAAAEKRHDQSLAALKSVFADSLVAAEKHHDESLAALEKRNVDSHAVLEKRLDELLEKRKQKVEKKRWYIGLIFGIVMGITPMIWKFLSEHHVEIFNFLKSLFNL